VELFKEQKIVADDKKKLPERFFGEDAAKKGFPVSRRAFLGGLGAGIASLMIPFGKTATKVAPKVVAEMSAKGMPSWFPLLVNKIKTQGKQTEIATGGRHPTNTYMLKSPDGDEYYLYEDAVSGNIEISARGENMQQVSFEYVPSTEIKRPGGKSLVEDSEFYASEFQKGEYQDYENTLGSIDDLKLGIRNIEDFATSGKMSKGKAEKEVASFLTDTTKIDYDGFAQGGRVGYESGSSVQPLTKEEYEKRVRMQAAWQRESEMARILNRNRENGYSIPLQKEGLSGQGYYNSMDELFFGGINYNDGNKNLNVGTVIPREGQPSYNAEFSYSFANGGPVIRPQGTLPPQRGPMHAGISNLFKQKGTNT
jgi:hypothetical protein